MITLDYCVNEKNIFTFSRDLFQKRSINFHQFHLRLLLLNVEKTKYGCRV